MLFKVSEIDRNLLDILIRNNSAKIHSVFSNGLNFKVADKIVFLGSRKGPNTIYVPQEIIKKEIKNIKNERISIISGHVIVGNLILDLNNATSKSYQINKKLKDQPIRKKNIENFIIQKNYITGLDLSTLELLNNIERIYYENSMDFLEYLMGRGKGLTPSGDDIILGMMFWDCITPYLDTKFKEQIKELLKKNKTNDISAGFLGLALNCKFMQEVLDVYIMSDSVYGLSKAIEILLRFGAYSGKDILAGILLGIIIERRSYNEK